MSDWTPTEMDRTRRLMSWVVLIVLAGIAAIAVSIACGKKTETPSGSPAASVPAPTASPAVAGIEETPAFRETAAPGEAPYAAVQQPFDCAVDDRGRLWVLDSANGRVRVFDDKGGYLGGWGGNLEKGEYSFRGPEGIAISGDSVYIADTWAGGVRAFSRKGEPLGRAAGLYGPRGIAAGAGAVWVTDTGNGRLMAYDAQLKTSRVIGKPGTGGGEFNGPVGIAIGPSGTLFVGDSGNARVQVLDKDGRFVRSWNLPWLKTSWQAHVAVDSRGTVYVSYPDGASVLAFDNAGAQRKAWTADDSGAKLVRPVGVAVDGKAGVLYVMDTGSHRVRRIALSGATAR
ncbi:MAG TPA: NHL repeat-containing protein [Thermoanaerobaculia bacterium]|nr:NHL repeat-containing protein [Thermoanaerobaculia bacterium]